MAKKDVAEIRHCVEDGGHFGFSYCSNCNEELYSSSKRVEKIPVECPKCGFSLTMTNKLDDFGGSDF